MRGLALSVIAVALLTSACAAAKKGGQFAGLTPYQADNRAQDLLAQEESDPASPLHGMFLSIADETQGRRPNGGQAWVATLETRNHKQLATCIFVWGTAIAFQDTTHYFLDDCPASV